jgi:hypothetical protein
MLHWGVGMPIQSYHTGSSSLVVASLAGAVWLLAAAQSVAAPRQLDCSLTIRNDAREQRTEARAVKFIYDERERTLFYVDDGGGTKKCINSAVGTLEIMGSCGSQSVWINKSTNQLVLNSFDYRWNPRRHINEETWAYEEKGWCQESDARPPQ